jgi:hypothetical protein
MPSRYSDRNARVAQSGRPRMVHSVRGLSSVPMKLTRFTGEPGLPPRQLYDYLPGDKNTADPPLSSLAPTQIPIQIFLILSATMPPPPIHSAQTISDLFPIPTQPLLPLLPQPRSPLPVPPTPRVPGPLTFPSLQSPAGFLRRRRPRHHRHPRPSVLPIVLSMGEGPPRSSRPRNSLRNLFHQLRLTRLRPNGPERAFLQTPRQELPPPKVPSVLSPLFLMFREPLPGRPFRHPHMHEILLPVVKAA